MTTPAIFWTDVRPQAVLNDTIIGAANGNPTQWVPGSATATVVTSSTTSNQNNWAPGLQGNTVILWSGAGDITVTGFAGGVTGQMVTFKNTGTNAATFSHNSGSSSAGNKLFNIATSSGTPVAGNGFATWVYDGTQWQLISHSQGSWIVPGYNSANFSADTGANWTVESGDVDSFAYYLTGRTLQVIYDLRTTSLGSGISFLIISNGAYGGFTHDSQNVWVPGFQTNNALAEISLNFVGASNIFLYRNTAQDFWASSTNNTRMAVLVTFSVI